MSKTIQCRLSDSEFEKLGALVDRVNNGGWEKISAWRNITHQPGYGKITISDVMRAMVGRLDHDELQPRSRERNTTAAARVLQKRILTRNTKSRRSPGQRNTSTRKKR